MIAAALVMLVFEICPASGRMCEDGFALAQSCERAEQWLRDGLKPGQTLLIHECRPYRPGDWRAVD